PEVKVRIGGNFRPDQVASYERLMDRLEEAGLGGQIEALNFKPVIDTSSKGEGGGCTGCGSSEADVQSLAMLREAGGAGGSPRRSLTGGPPRNPCELHWKNSYVIDPEGRVYKCPAVAGRPEMAVATVREDEERIAPLLELRPWEQCGGCPF